MKLDSTIRGITRATTPGTATASCEPWCVLHDSTNPGEEVCGHVTGAWCALGALRIESVNGTPVIWGLEDANEGMHTVESARDYARALLAAADRAESLANGRAA